MKGVPFVNRGYTKWVPFLSRLRGWTSGWPGASSYKIVLILPGIPGVFSKQYQFSLLRFVFRIVEASAKRERLVMNRKGPWEGYRQQAKRRLARCLLPAFLCAHIFIERERRLGRRQIPIAAVHGCHCRGDIVVSMCKVLAWPYQAIPRSWPYVCAEIGIRDLYISQNAPCLPQGILHEKQNIGGKQSVLYPACSWFVLQLSQKVVGKNVHATIPKGNMGYDQ